MRVYVCFDDTDTLDAERGTGKLARWYAEELPPGCTPWGVVRQQLLVDPRVPYTSHNSSACVVVDAESDDVLPALIDLAGAHLARHWIEGSDPGLCVAVANGASALPLIEFGRRAAVEFVTQEEARASAEAAGAHLSGHGGTNDGVIGAAAGVGLTIDGWSGRFVDFGALRHLPSQVTVAEIEAIGASVLPVDRNVVAPKPTDIVDTQDWLRPRLWGGVPCVPVVSEGSGRWTAIAKRAPDPREVERP